MKAIIIIIIAVLMASCDEMAKKKPEVTGGLGIGQSVSVVVIDSCEYVIWENNHFSGGICHKGNCKFCKQRKENNNEQ